MQDDSRSGFSHCCFALFAIPRPYRIALAAMTDLFTTAFIDWIATTLGIRIRDSDRNLIWQRILTRVKVLGLPSAEAYHRFLVAKSQSIAWEAEWRELVNLLTVTESYFFRDQGQFGLLRHRIVAELIQRQRQACESTPYHRPQLRVWSAGCSTGEEAYSLAILLKELIPDSNAWDIRVLGTDVNGSALERAKRGLYNDWSFRTVDPAIRQKYFRLHRNEWEIDPEIRKMVQFQMGNLVQDQYPASYSDIHNFDLILCRNVFIYFSTAAIALVLEKFYNSLAIGGYLMTGHTELYGQTTERFQVISYPESTVYQRSAATRSPITLAPALSSTQVNPLPASSGIASPAVKPIAASLTPAVASSPAALPSSQPPRLDRCNELVALIQRKAYLEAIDQAKHLISLEPNHFQAHCLLAEAYANLGNYLTAIQVCQQAIQINPLAVEPYYLLAQISEEQSDREGAKVFLKRIIYLVPTSVPAYLELGALYEQEGNLQKAKRTWQSALDLLILMTPETVVEQRQNLTVAQVRSTIEKNLQKK